MKSRLSARICAVVAPLAMASPALAAQQVQPTKPVPVDLYSGRWYEVARTPNRMQANCQASTTDFSGWSDGDFSAVQTCHKGAPTGPVSSISVHGRVLPASMNAKMQLSMMGGLLAQQYWILDHAQDDNWLIMTTPNDHYVWILARTPVLSPAAKAAAMSRLQSLGLDVSRLAFQQQAAR